MPQRLLDLLPCRADGRLARSQLQQDLSRALLEQFLLFGVRRVVAVVRSVVIVVVVAYCFHAMARHSRELGGVVVSRGGVARGIPGVYMYIRKEKL